MQLPDEEVDGPEVGAAFREVGGAAVAYLVVEDDLPPVTGEVGQREQVVVRAPGPAVQHDERQRLPAAGVRSRVPRICACPDGLLYRGGGLTILYHVWWVSSVPWKGVVKSTVPSVLTVLAGRKSIETTINTPNGRGGVSRLPAGNGRATRSGARYQDPAGVGHGRVRPPGRHRRSPPSEIRRDGAAVARVATLLVLSGGRHSAAARILGSYTMRPEARRPQPDVISWVVAAGRPGYGTRMSLPVVRRPARSSWARAATARGYSAPTRTCRLALAIPSKMSLARHSSSVRSAT